LEKFLLCEVFVSLKDVSVKKISVQAVISFDAKVDEKADSDTLRMEIENVLEDAFYGVYKIKVNGPISVDDIKIQM